MRFELHIGIDYSGAQTPMSRMSALQVYIAEGGEPQRVISPAVEYPHWNWTRAEIAHWVLDRLEEGRPIAVGIDHGFSFPRAYFRRYGLKTWDEFLDDFVDHWPTDGPNTYVDFVRRDPPPRTGRKNEFRLTERWTSSAKSVFHFDVQGQVAKSTHAGIPWLRTIRRLAGGGVHFWPFDGWEVPAGMSVIAEVYPSVLRRRYPTGDRTGDQHDAYSVAQWLADCDERAILDHYLLPPLTEDERAVAALEGWILGIS